MIQDHKTELNVFIWSRIFNVVQRKEIWINGAQSITGCCSSGLNVDGPVFGPDLVSVLRLLTEKKPCLVK